MKIEIKDRWTQKLLFEGDFECVKAALENAAAARADLSGAYLSGADLSGADLSGAYLSGAYLWRANLSRANLSGADLSGAYLSGAYLSGANLSGAYLSGAYLSGAYLSGAYLSGANLSGANLSGADLSGANLSGAYLSGANLSGANLSRANDAALAVARTSIVPEVGEFTGWKQYREGRIVTVKILSSAKRSNACGRKCRAEAVEVLAIDGNGFAVSIHDCETIYRVGEIVRCDKWNEDRWTECGGGIHFYLTRIEAEKHS